MLDCMYIDTDIIYNQALISRDRISLRVSVITHYHFLYNLKDNIANVIFYNV